MFFSPWAVSLQFPTAETVRSDVYFWLQQNISLLKSDILIAVCLILAGKKQKHDMVHVEIWYGEGEKTIGARWQKGR